MKSDSKRRRVNSGTTPRMMMTLAMLVIVASLMVSAASGLTMPLVALAATGSSSSYSVNGETSCKALPLSGGHATWNSSGNQCTLPAAATLILSNNDTLALGSGIMLVNQGSIQNDGGGMINIASSAMIHNEGAFDNTGKVSGSGSIKNTGVLNNAATIALSTPGGIENAKTGVLNNSGSIHTGSLANAGTIFNSGLIDSKSHVKNTGVVVNSGTIKSPP